MAARTLLYRRETSLDHASASSTEPSWIRSVRNLAGVDLCLYAALSVNIRNLKPHTLARLALLSAAQSAGADGRDGISYLATQLQRGVVTPLSSLYRQEILRLVGAADLSGALEVVRRNPNRFLAA
jgi:hypothetical protein